MKNSLNRACCVFLSLMLVSSLSLLLLLLFSIKPAHVSDDVVRHRFYIVSYDESKKNPRWVCWEIPKTNGCAAREGLRFRKDPLARTPSPRNYTGSGYDLGHMCPAADMSFSKEAMTETFFMSNVSPQIPKLNRGDWKELEAFLREEGKLTEIWCVAGPCFQEGHSSIGEEKVAVPYAFWKVVFGGTGETERAWFFVNAATNRMLPEYRIGYRELERIVGIDFRSCTNKARMK